MFFWHVLFQVIDEFDQNVHFVEIDIEEDPEIAEAAGIMGTPCVQYFKNKEMLKLVLFELSPYSVMVLANSALIQESLVESFYCWSCIGNHKGVYYYTSNKNFSLLIS